jgi:hypothetical protein
MPTIATAVGSIAALRGAAVIAGAVLPRTSSCSSNKMPKTKNYEDLTSWLITY